MKVFCCAGFNLYGQFNDWPDKVIGTFMRVFENSPVEIIEVSHTFNVLLVADTLRVCGAQNATISNLAPYGKIRQIACNESYILLLSESNELWKCSTNRLGNFERVNLETDCKTICCGAKFAMAQTTTGRFFNLPTKLDFEHGGIVDIRAGRLHCLLLDDAGNVYSWGSGGRGELGHGNLEDLSEPKLIEALAGVKMVKIAAGGWHSAAVSRDGDVYTWGWNSNGQLGLDNESVVATPSAVLLESNVRDVACGSRHTVLLMENGEVWGCGWNKYGQIGGQLGADASKFRFIGDFGRDNVVGVKCGPWSSLVECKKEIKKC